jgi:two-component system phosphate regulon sensor histidine kinase PhoR
MTHEFKTPLTSNQIAIEFLQNNVSIVSDTRLKKYVDLLAMQNVHLNSQVERILQTSLLERKNFPIKLKEVELNSLISKIIESFRISDKREYTINGPQNPVIVKADEIHLTNLLYSIIDNARKYSSSDSIIQLLLETKSDFHELSVCDQGCGIPKSQQNKVFRKFYRIPKGNVHDVKGFGIGLFYVKKVIDRHGWKVILESEPGNGTQITIKIPRKT